MNRLLENMYYSSPVVVQNIATTIYGYYLHRTRYGKRSQQYEDALRESQYWSRDRISNYQLAALKGMLEEAYASVPHYRSSFEHVGFTPDSIKTLDDLRRLPVLEKATIRTSPLSLLSSKRYPKVLTLHTSGTTGTPLTLYCDLEGRIRHYAFLSRFRAWFGVKVGMKRATFGGRIVVQSQRPPFWRYDLTENNHLFSSYHMSEANLGHYYQKLRDIEPIEICGYSSSIYVLAKYILKNRLKPIHPRLIMTTAETLSDLQRECIEDAFQCKVRDQYGCTEMALFIAQCEHGTYHAHPEYGIIEVVDEHGNWVEPGRPGEVLCTSFMNRQMPLIRYRLGDILELGAGACACGRHFPIINRIIGREDDILVTPDGNPLGRLDPIFKASSGVCETQIVQTATDALKFNIVKDVGMTDGDISDLLYEIKKRTGNSMKIEICFVPEIPRDKNGKFRAVINQVKR